MLGSDNQNYAASEDPYMDPEMEVIEDNGDEDDDNKSPVYNNAAIASKDPTNVALNEPAAPEEVTGDDDLMQAYTDAIDRGLVDPPMILHAISNY